jgi:hypothetical protein
MTEDQIDIEKIAHDYSHIISTPLLPLLRINYIKNQIKNLPYEVIENNYSLIVKVPGKSTRKMVFMTHLDHPGIIVKK